MPRTVSITLDEFERICRQWGLPLTIQRRVIFQAFVRRDDHPTADDVYDEVLAQIRGISRSTVYRALETLVRIGVASKVPHLGAAVHFEIKAERHHHLVCNDCNQVIDLEDSSLNTLPFPNTRRFGFKISDYSIQFRGVCSGCMAVHAPKNI